MFRFINQIRNNNSLRFIYNKIKKACVFIIPVIVVSFVEYQTGFLGDQWNNYFGKLRFIEGIVTPLHYYEMSEQYDAKMYSEMYGKEMLDHGCLLNIYVYNEKNKPIMISKTSIIIDEIKTIEQYKVYIVGVYAEIDNSLTIYAVNNGLADFDKGKVYINVEYYNNEFGEKEAIQEQQYSMLGVDKILEIEDLHGGEIRKIISYKLDENMMKKLGVIYMFYHIIDENDNLVTESYNETLGLLQYVDSKWWFSISEGVISENAIERSLSIDSDTDSGEEINVPAGFMIEGENWKNIIYAIYPTSSCDLTFHAKVKCAGSKKEIETDVYKQKIYVPLYKDEDNLFISVRKFIEDYSIDTYYYNSNPIIQKDIDYVPFN